MCSCSQDTLWNDHASIRLILQRLFKHQKFTPVLSLWRPSDALPDPGNRINTSALKLQGPQLRPHLCPAPSRISSAITLTAQRINLRLSRPSTQLYTTHFGLQLPLHCIRLLYHFGWHWSEFENVAKNSWNEMKKHQSPVTAFRHVCHRARFLPPWDVLLSCLFVVH